MKALWQAIGEALALVTVAAIFTLAITEAIGARFPPFVTISEATRTDVAQGDYRLFVAVLALFLIGALWWALHILLHL